MTYETEVNDFFDIDRHGHIESFENVPYGFINKHSPNFLCMRTSQQNHTKNVIFCFTTRINGEYKLTFADLILQISLISSYEIVP